MSRTSTSQESEDEGFSIGTPTLSEIKDYFSTVSTSTYPYYTAESSSSDSSGELSESFVELLENRKQEQTMKYPTQRIQKTPETPTMKYPTQRIQKTPETPSRWLATADDSFLAAEKMCEKTLDYNRYMRANARALEPPEQGFPNLEDETLLNDVEPPSMLCEQTMRNPVNRPSTILEETTITSSDSFRTAELVRAIPRLSGRSSGNDEESLMTDDEGEITMSEAGVENVIELSSSGSEGVDNVQEEEEESVEEVDVVQQEEALDSISQAPSTDSHPSSKTEEESTLDLSREFNDTLEKVEYFMKKGEQVLKNKQYEPPKVITPSSSSSSSGAIPKTFKQPALPSRIPQIKSKKWDHIKSPISAYIHKTPVVPLITNNKAFNDKIERAAGSPRARMVGTVKEKENQAENTPPKGRQFPKKACISAPYAVIHDERTTPKFAGGAKMQKLLGDQVNPDHAIVTTRMGRYKTQRLPPEVVEQERRKMTLTEDSIADLSLISGDVSVHVLKSGINF